LSDTAIRLGKKYGLAFPEEELEKDAEDPKPKRELKVGDRATYWGPYTPWRDCELTIMDVGRYGRVTANMDDGMIVIDQ